METCESCRFYFPIDKNGNQGQCRWEPPKLFVLPAGSAIAGGPPNIELRALFPILKSGAWCGRWEVPQLPPGTVVEIVPEDEKTIKLAD